MNAIKNIDTLSAMIALALVALDTFLWFRIFSERRMSGMHEYFLDVGQGDAEMVIFPGDIKIMTDSGPDDKVRESLEKVLPSGDRYIDIAIISHPQLDHFNGYNYLLDEGYRFGAFVYNGRNDGPGVSAWPELIQKINSRGIPLITLAAGDKIYFGRNEIAMLSPNHDFGQSAELNDTGLVELVKTPEFRTLLTADTGFNVEDFLMKNKADVRVDVLKVGHHGSKYSSGSGFLRAVDPKISVIEVGAKNTYGHPAKSTLGLLASETRALVLRTDKNGTIEIWMEGGKLSIRKEK